ncbi:cation-translocating P-type ATPase [Klenkia terrae]|uniref:cation-translocating P-type ATPase n=1 Tax=Klenkia terrae TaxID=1052259 RepID=UPI00360A6AD9
MTALAARGEPAWTRPGAEVAHDQGTDPGTGLTGAEAARRLARDGPNEVAVHPSPPLWRSVLGQLSDVLVLVLLAAAVLTAITGDLVDTAVIGLVVAVNTVLGVAQERRALREVQALDDLVAPTARVTRDGTAHWVPTRELVAGDLLALAAGDVVGADARLLAAVRLQVDEALLTGESQPSERDAGHLADADAPAADRAGMVHAGSTVLRGSGTAVVVATGPATAIGQVAVLVAAHRSPQTPLQRRLAVLGRQISLAVAAACLLFVASGLLRGQPWETTVVAAVALAVAAVPESLPAVVALALSAGAGRMGRRGAVVRSLPAVETLGSVTLLATDKTGTLTRGAMVVDRVWTPAEGEVDLPADTPGCVHCWRRRRCATTPTPAAPAPVATGAPRTPRPPWCALPGPPAATWRRCARRTPDGGGALRRGGPPDDDGAPRAGRRRAHPGEGGTGGAPGRGGPATAVADRWAADGGRVLAVTADGVLLGLVSMADPVRPEAAAAVAALHRAGIVVVVVTGDHAGTAAAVARQVGVLGAGEEPGARVHARVEPAGKLDLVTGWQAAGHVVAMTGDGVNDAPALRAADIGVAMGRRGTEVAKEAADLVLVDDSLATVTAAVAEGRRVFDNVRRFVGYGLAGGLAEVLVMLAGPAVGLALPLLPAQVLWVNLLTHGPVGVAMGGEPAAPDVLARRPRNPVAGVLDRSLVTQLVANGLAVTVVCLAVAGISRAADGPWQTQLFISLAVAQLALALALRPAGAWSRHRAGVPWLPVAVAVNLVLLAAAVLLPALSDLMGTEPLTALQTLAAVGPALVPASLVLLVRRLR